MAASALTAHGPARDDAFFLTALTYAQYLWQKGAVARSILKVDRAFGADLRGDERVLHDWPLPYAALVWILRHAPATAFLGNPRVHFQHLADRMNEPRREQRRWRAWAGWALTRAARSEFPGDPKHVVTEPTSAEIADRLELHGLPGERVLWQEALQSVTPVPR